MPTELVINNETSLHPDCDPLDQYIEAFASRLFAHGYATATVHSKMRALRHFRKWLGAEQIKFSELSQNDLSIFFEQHATPAHIRRGDAFVVRAFVECLGEIGAISPPFKKEEDIDEYDPIECEFARYLAEERGLAETTLSRYSAIVHSFLAECFPLGTVAPGEIGASDVTQFITSCAQTVSPRSAQLAASALRSFFRFLLYRGEIACDLAACVPKVANWRLSSIPKYLVSRDVEKLLLSCDRNTATGQRDYAILLILARLGLRAGEIVAMQLDDIDWDAGVLTIHGKGSRRDQLPIPQDVGKAMATYLHGGRPRCTTRRVFIRARAPRVGFMGSAAVDGIMSRSLARAGLSPVRKGAHLLRHSLATSMLQHEASLAEIGEILRHSRPETTEIYAKVDLVALAALALPWPGGDV